MPHFKRPCANKFNDYFVNIHTASTDIIDPATDIYFSKLQSINHDISAFIYNFCNRAFVYNQPTRLDISTSTGSDNISPKYLKLAAPVIAP